MNIVFVTHQYQNFAIQNQSVSFCHELVFDCGIYMEGIVYPYFSILLSKHHPLGPESMTERPGP